MRLLAEQIAFSFFRRERAGEMLQPGEVIDADVVRNRRIVFAVGGGVDQSGGAAPIFIGSVGEKNPGHNFISGWAIEQAGRLSRDGIFFWSIGKGKDIGWKED